MRKNFPTAGGTSPNPFVGVTIINGSVTYFSSVISCAGRPVFSTKRRTFPVSE